MPEEKDKKCEERKALKAFLDLDYRGQWSIQSEGERPDFRITLLGEAGPRNIGIEVTRYADDLPVGSGAQGGARSAWLQNVAKSVHKQLRDHLCKDRDTIGVLHIAVKYCDIPEKAESRCLAWQLREVIAAHGPFAVHGRVDLDRHPDDPDAPWPFANWQLVNDYVEYLSVERLSDDTAEYPDPQLLGGAFCVPLSPVVKCIIEGKARKLSKYDRTGLDECWLLVYARGWPPTEFIPDENDLDEAANDEDVRVSATQSRFDRVVLCDCAHRRYRDLRPCDDQPPE